MEAGKTDAEPLIGTTGWQIIRYDDGPVTAARQAIGWSMTASPSAALTRPEVEDAAQVFEQVANELIAAAPTAEALAATLSSIAIWTSDLIGEVSTAPPASLMEDENLLSAGIFHACTVSDPVARMIAVQSTAYAVARFRSAEQTFNEVVNLFCTFRFMFDLMSQQSGATTEQLLLSMFARS